MTFSNAISVRGTTLSRDVLSLQNLLPRGSALITRSGNLADKGIVAIVHAATGSMSRSGGIYEPGLRSIADSVFNSFELLKSNGYKRMAVPFIGGNIFATRIGVPKEIIARTILDATLKDYGNRAVFVTYGSTDTAIFRSLLERDWPDFDASEFVLEGSIIDFQLHRAPVIMNAANMEVTFGGGLSGIIAAATGMADEINLEATNAIHDFWNTLKSNP